MISWNVMDSSQSSTSVPVWAAEKAERLPSSPWQRPNEATFMPIGSEGSGESATIMRRDVTAHRIRPASSRFVHSPAKRTARIGFHADSRSVHSDQADGSGS